MAFDSGDELGVTIAPEKNADLQGLGYAWFAIAMLAVCYMLAYIDRAMITLFVEPIKSDLRLSDLQISLLIGLAFALFYSAFGIPLARIGDRSQRVRVIVLCIVVFSVMTVLTAFAETYSQMFALRIGVAIGEAGLMPLSISLIADYLPREKLGRGVALFNAGGFSGMGLSMLVGGLAIHLAGAGGPITLPFGGDLTPWRTAFLAVGIAGLLLALLALATLREPSRRQQVADRNNTGDLLRILNADRSNYLAVLGGMALLALGIFGMFAWYPTFLLRIHDMPHENVGFMLGVSYLISYIGGTMLAGLLVDRLTRRGVEAGPLIIGCIAAGLAVPLLAGALVVPNVWASVCLFTIGTLCGIVPVTACVVALQLITPNRHHASVAALYGLVTSVFGLALGPMIVALITEQVFQDQSMLGTSMLICSSVAISLAALSFWRGISLIGRSLTKNRS